MPFKSEPILPRFPHMLHGGDYNPEQWVHAPEVWDEDVRLMKLAGVNCVSVGIFAWSALEPEEGRYDFGWMDRVMDKLARADIQVNLATPGGARPAWMAAKYPEVLRVDAQRRRQLWGGRHNHCFTSPVFREKCQLINERLADRYKGYSNLAVWHINNEYSGDCHCNLCQDAFRAWVRNRYRDDLDRLNEAWWARFWSHAITDWSQIQSPSPIGEREVHGMNLDWRRFASDQTIACFRDEIAPLRRITPGVPITTNFMGRFSGLDYYEFAKELDVISWDSYPSYHDRADNVWEAVYVSFIHEQRRAMLQRSFMLMECAPAQQNYKAVCKLKRPGIHALEAMQAIANGSDSVLYFQWRKSRGSVEKFHGAVVDHYATEHTRVFREVAEVGDSLAKLDAVVGARTQAEVALIFDYQNSWAIDDTKGPRNERKDYQATCVEHYRAFWQAGVPVDILGEESTFEGYKLLIAPMLYMIRPGVAERISKFVREGGTLVTTYFSGVVNESDLCFQNGFPGPLRELCGIWAEEIDTLYDDESVPIVPVKSNSLGLKSKYRGGQFCDLIHCEAATPLATYGGEFYEDRPALTVNRFGRGEAYYIASRNDAKFHDDFYRAFMKRLRLRRVLDAEWPEGVMVASRGESGSGFVFLLNFARKPASINLGRTSYRNVLDGKQVTGRVKLDTYGHLVLARKKSEPKKEGGTKPLKRVAKPNRKKRSATAR